MKKIASPKKTSALKKSASKVRASAPKVKAGVSMKPQAKPVSSPMMSHSKSMNHPGLGSTEMKKPGAPMSHSSSLSASPVNPINKDRI